MKWVKIDEPIPEEEFIKQIKINGKKLCLIRHHNQLYAVQNTCPHADGILSGGWCKDGQVVCPIHRYTYNLATGRGAKGQGDYIDTYPIEERIDGVYIGFKEGLWKRFFR